MLVVDVDCANGFLFSELVLSELALESLLELLESKRLLLIGNGIIIYLQRKKKEIIPRQLVQYHQYSKCISFARARLPGVAALHASEALLAAINSPSRDD